MHRRFPASPLRLWPGDADINGKIRIDRLPDGSTLMLDTLVLKGDLLQPVPPVIQYRRPEAVGFDENSPLIAQKLETNFSATPKVGQP